MRITVILLALSLVAVPGSSQAPKPVQPRPATQNQDQLDGNQQLFAVLAALTAAGYDYEFDSPTNHPLRKYLRDSVAAQKLDSTLALRRFVSAHRRPDPAAEFSQYVSYALAIEGPPNFEMKYHSLPPDASQLDGFAPLVAAFYKEAHLDELWTKVQPYYDQVIAQYQAPVVQSVLQVNAYLRNPTNGFLGRRFQIYVDLLGPPNQVQTRSYADDYFVVVTPAVELPIADIQHSYLHFLADPLALKFSNQLSEKKQLHEYSQVAPTLEESYKSDYILMATESFIRAVESRMQRKPAMADQAVREGYVMAGAFADQLAVYEKQDTAMRLYFPDLVQAIDVKKEQKRLQAVSFITERATRKIQPVAAPAPKPVELSPAEKTLEEAEQAYTARDLPRAKDVFLGLLKLPDEKPLHAKSYYGLARIAVLERDPELGDRLFRRVLELEPDDSTKSWSLLYLARLADSQGEREQAADHYRAALAVPGVPDSVRQAAEKGLKEAFTNK